MDKNVSERSFTGKVINIALWLVFAIIAIYFIPIIFVIIGLAIALIYYFKSQQNEKKNRDSSKESDVNLDESTKPHESDVSN
jgi:predicted histidine transporter YuiF (NhaC family)